MRFCQPGCSAEHAVGRSSQQLVVTIRHEQPVQRAAEPGFGEETSGKIELLEAQIEAGAEVVQLFDSWAGILPEPAFLRWVIEALEQPFVLAL